MKSIALLTMVFLPATFITVRNTYPRIKASTANLSPTNTSLLP